MATQVAIEDLETWLGNQPVNTVDTPYEIEITGLTTENYTDLDDIILANPQKYLDLRETVLPDGITKLIAFFWGAINLIGAPLIPSSVEVMNGCFRSCTNLKYPPAFPDYVEYINYCFMDCTSLEYKPIFPSSVTASIDCYSGVTQTRWGGSLEQVNSWIPNQTNEFEIVVIGTDRVIYGIDVNNLSSWLNNQPENTTETPFEIDVIGITEPNYPSIKSALLANPTKYVDLGYTVIGYMIGLSSNYQRCTSLVGAPTFEEGTTYVDDQFRYCINLKKVPPLPSTVISMSLTFGFCTSLSEPVVVPNGVTSLAYTFMYTSIQRAPVIPNTVTSMRSTFQGCTLLDDNNIVIPDSVTTLENCFNGCISLKNVKKIPSSVTVMIDAFYNCTSLRKIERFEVPLNTLKNNSNFENAFEGCTSLEQIGYKINETNWHVFHLFFSSISATLADVSGKVYGVNQGGITEVTIPTTRVSFTQNGKLILPDYTDELWFPEPVATSQIEIAIQKMLTYKYGVFNKEVLPPDEKNFVLWAQDPNNFRTNIPISAVDFIEQGNMSPVTSNAVASELKPTGLITLGNPLLSAFAGHITSSSTVICWFVPFSDIREGASVEIVTCTGIIRLAEQGYADNTSPFNMNSGKPTSAGGTGYTTEVTVVPRVGIGFTTKRWFKSRYSGDITQNAHTNASKTDSPTAKNNQPLTVSMDDLSVRITYPTS